MDVGIHTLPWSYPVHVLVERNEQAGRVDRFDHHGVVLEGRGLRLGWRVGVVDGNDHCDGDRFTLLLKASDEGLLCVYRRTRTAYQHRGTSSRNQGEHRRDGFDALACNHAHGSSCVGSDVVRKAFGGSDC